MPDQLMEWIFPRFPIYWLDRSGDLTRDLVQALLALREDIQREYEALSR